MRLAAVDDDDNGDNDDNKNMTSYTSKKQVNHQSNQQPKYTFASVSH